MIEKPEAAVITSGGFRKCDSQLGTVSYCTSVIGMVAAGKAVDIIVDGEFRGPNVNRIDENV